MSFYAKYKVYDTFVIEDRRGTTPSNIVYAGLVQSLPAPTITMISNNSYKLSYVCSRLIIEDGIYNTTDFKALFEGEEEFFTYSLENCMNLLETLHIITYEDDNVLFHPYVRTTTITYKTYNINAPTDNYDGCFMGYCFNKFYLDSALSCSIACGCPDPVEDEFPYTLPLIL